VRAGRRRTLLRAPLVLLMLPPLAALGALATLTGCGQTGPLTLPGAAAEDASAAETSSAAQNPNAAAEAGDDDGEENGR
jgi:predicted small lipoprotein YifL